MDDVSWIMINEEGVHLGVLASVIEYCEFYMCIALNMSFGAFILHIFFFFSPP